MIDINDMNKYLAPTTTPNRALGAQNPKESLLKKDAAAKPPLTRPKAEFAEFAPIAKLQPVH